MDKSKPKQKTNSKKSFVGRIAKKFLQKYNVDVRMRILGENIQIKSFEMMDKSSEKFKNLATSEKVTEREKIRKHNVDDAIREQDEIYERRLERRLKFKQDIIQKIESKDHCIGKILNRFLRKGTSKNLTEILAERAQRRERLKEIWLGYDKDGNPVQRENLVEEWLGYDKDGNSKQRGRH